MALTITAQPAEEPVTVARVERHLRLTDTDTDEQADLLELIQEAREYAETYQGRAYITQTLRLHVAAATTIELPRPPFRQINAVLATDADGVNTSIDSTDYAVDETGLFAVLTIASLPAGAQTITVDYDAGYGDDGSAVPARIKRALLLLCGHWYENREPVGGGGWIHELSHTVKALLDLDRVQWGAL